MGRPKLASAILLVAAIAVPVATCVKTANAADKAITSFSKAVVKRDYKKSFALIRSAALAGNTGAQYKLAVLYRLGVGVPQDEQKARIWLARAAAKGNKPAVRLLSKLSAPAIPKTAPKAIGLDAKKPDQAFVPPVSANARNAAGFTWLMRAVVRGLPATVMSFLKSGSDVDAISPDGSTALSLASTTESKEIVSTLLKSGASIDQPDSKKQTVLMKAVFASRDDVIAILLEAGADVSQRDVTGETALFHVARTCDADAAQMLVQRRLPLAEIAKSRSPLHLAAMNCKDQRLAKVLGNSEVLDAIDVYGRTPLWYAASAGNIETVKTLIASGARAGQIDNNGMSPLHIAALRGHAGVMKLLLENSVDATTATTMGDTPLHLAAASNCTSCIALLTALPGSKVNGKNTWGDTALIVATRNLNVDAAKILLATGADPLSRNKLRETAASIAGRIGTQPLVALFDSH